MSVWSYCRRLVSSRRPRAPHDTDLARELASWVAELSARYEAAGATPAEARRRALIETGGVEQVKEAVRGVRVGAALDACLRDARHAWRGLRKFPTFTFVVIATLALGIGATTAIFSVVDAMLIAPLPYRDSSQLVFVWSDMAHAGYPRAPLSGPELADLRQRATQFTGFGAVWATSGTLTGDGEAEQLRLGVVTPDFFSILGVNPALGRAFVREDEPPLIPNRIILSGSLWRRRYGADPGIVGRQIRVLGESMTVVGVMPDDFRLLLPRDAAVPEDLDAFVPFNRMLATSPRTTQFIRVIGRLRNGVTVQQAQTEIAEIGSRLSQEFTDYGTAGRTFTIAPLQRDVTREVRAPVLALFAGVGILLAIACLNVANLLVARAATRTRETALRMAVGAGPVQLIRQSLIEGIVLAALGGAAGLLVGRWGLTLLIALRPESLTRLASARIDPLVLIFTAGTALTWGLLFSLAPMAVQLRTDFPALHRDVRQPQGAIHYRARAALVIAQVALGVTLLVSAELLVRTFVALQHVDPGFRSDAALSFRLPFFGSRHRTPEAMISFARTLEAKLAALPGVTGVGAVTHLPFDNIGNWAGPYTSKLGQPKATAGVMADYRAIGPGYFEAVGAQRVDGRFFDETDGPTGEPVAIVDELLARRFWKGERAVGRRFAVDPNSTGHTDRMVTVVGVVRHVRLHSLMEEVREQIYLPWRQTPWSPIAYVVRTSGDPAALAPVVRRVVAELDPLMPVYDLRPLVEYTVKARATQRFTMVLASAFAVVAVVLACVGVYGVIAYSVARRRQEFGVRLALGARPAGLIRLVLADGMKLTGAGLLIGIAGALASARVLRHQLYGISPHDVSSYAIAVPLLGVCAIVACLIPAWRATGNDAIDTLKTE